ncbi:MAG: ABC transporter permease [Bacillota bacterium]|nr:MAG: ABC transporter permease [Bacillota bacterium]
MNRVVKGFKDLAQYPSAIAGLVLISLFVALAVYAMVTMPLGQAIELWRGSGDVWQYTPRNAAPAWLNVFPGINKPVTMDFNTANMPEAKTVEEIAPGMWEVRVSFPFDFTYDEFPTEINVFTTVRNSTARPFFSMRWLTPDGREIPLGDVDLRASESFRLGQDARLTRRLGGRPAHMGLFADPNASEAVPLKGRYELVAEALVFEPDTELDVRLVVYGQLHGLAGTDHRRRDLTVALLWGTPIALAMGLMGAIGATVTTMAIAAVGTWYGGWVDNLIQRITEINMMLPGYPLLIMIGTLVDRNLLLLTAIWVALSIFSASIKSYRAMFLQVKEAPYIEAAKSYSASNMRIIVQYMMPRIIPVLVPTFVGLVPSFVFFEATISVLGLGDPLLPTWGKVLSEAQDMGALHNGYYYWVLAPSLLLVFSGAGFALLGFALDRIFNPRLRSL